ncbi:hypothetical protein H106_06724 [Trichophyton rubrum CBS 735.88]|nr:hypothetical protein H106_06724 [Trichophyton rubrum CBS 735.88]
MSYVNWKSEVRSHAWIDAAAGELRANDTIQLERKGYYRVDQGHSDGKPLILFSIPTGKLA